MIRKVLELLRNMRGAESGPPARDHSADDASMKSSKKLKTPKTAAAAHAPDIRPGGGDSGRSSNKRIKVLIVGCGAVIIFMAGFVLTVTLLNHFRDSREAPAFGAAKADSLSNLPLPTMAAALQQPQIPGQGQGQPQATGEREAKEPSPAGQPKTESSPRQQGQALADKPPAAPVVPPLQWNAAIRGGNARPVTEYDPFKAEFLKKYEEAEKKEKRLRRKNEDEASLADLETTIKASSAKPVVPVQPSPPPPPPPKDPKLTVYGVVIAKGDAYALSDRGIIRVGNILDTFLVEKIEFDAVTLKSRENDKDVRNIFVSAKRDQVNAQQPSVYYPPGGAPGH